MKRRSMLRLVAGASMAAAARARAGTRAPPRRIVSLDWGLGEMLLSIGVVPVGLANTNGFRSSFRTSALPGSVVDLGLMFQPNMELLLALQPDLILVTPAHAALRASLERIAPTLTLGMFRFSPTPYTAASDETLQLARLLQREPEATAALADARGKIDRARNRLAACEPACGRPLHIAQFLDETHVRVFGPHSMYGEMLKTLGLRSAWQGSAHAAGVATVGYQALGSADAATLICLTPLPASVESMMKTSPLWRAMGYAAPGRMLALPLIPPGGGVVCAAHFAEGLADALAKTAQERA
ncbi:iron-siderophore ABC transporter substrate-binding protein [Paraburkholderia xenovorans]|uniref:iron-siderophore ABC transporter substrate-binding protein n=1 Tax=Paraburkholderia xenovorans TaxID=36873 RepID=UPI0038BC3DF9